MGKLAFYNVNSFHPKTQYQFSSVAQSCPTLCHPEDCSTPGFPVHHQLPELAQTHVHRVGMPGKQYTPPFFSSSEFFLKINK